MYKLEDIRLFCKKYGRKRLVLDTNLFLLVLIGGFEKDFLQNCNSTQKYCADDYDLILNILQYFETEIIITPHILSELSNISRRDIKEPKLSSYFKLSIDKLKSCREEHISLVTLLGVELKILTRFGFPDLSLIEVAKKVDAVIFTDDLQLHLHANLNKIPNINFNHIKNDILMNT